MSVCNSYIKRRRATCIPSVCSPCSFRTSSFFFQRLHMKGIISFTCNATPPFPLFLFFIHPLLFQPTVFFLSLSLSLFLLSPFLTLTSHSPSFPLLFYYTSSHSCIHTAVRLPPPPLHICTLVLILLLVPHILTLILI